jgi:hypothetical protein
MDARCLNCNNNDNYDIEKSKIICERCDIEIDYDKYIEIMKDKALYMADNFQNNWERTGF